MLRLLLKNTKKKKEYYPFYKIGKDLAKQAKNTMPKMSQENFIFILHKYHELAKEWANAKGKRYNEWHKQRAKEHLQEQIQLNFKTWTPL